MDGWSAFGVGMDIHDRWIRRMDGLVERRGGAEGRGKREREREGVYL